MNKNIEPGKSFYNPRDGMEYLWLALAKRNKTAWVIFKEFWLWPLIFVSLNTIFWHAVFRFVGW